MAKNDLAKSLGSLPDEPDRLTRRTDEVADWIAPLAFGLSPMEYATLNEALPGVVNHGNNRWEYRWTDIPEPTSDIARRSVGQVSKLVLRLWSSEALIYPSGR